MINRVQFTPVVILICLFMVVGCGRNNSLVLEMEAAYKLPSDSSIESNKHVAEMISMRFPKGMKVSDVLKEIGANEFAVYEYTLEGIRSWPNGDLEPYPRQVDDEKSRSIRKNHYIENQIDYRANFSYWPNPLERREVVVIIETHSELIVKAGGVIYSHTL
jgi:hypothetical protein